MNDNTVNIKHHNKKLFDLLVDTNAFRYSKDGFQLASGATSQYYFDLKLLNGNPAGIHQVALELYRRIKQMNPTVKSVGGLESGSISIATAVSQLSYLEHQRDEKNPLLGSFFVRKSQKDHGRQRLVEGVIHSPVVVVEDVITSGKSAITAVKAVKDLGYDCQCLLSIIFRGNDEQHKIIEKEISLEYIFHKDDLIDRLGAPFIDSGCE